MDATFRHEVKTLTTSEQTKHIGLLMALRVRVHTHTCSQPQLHLVFQDIANIQKSTAQPEKICRQYVDREIEKETKIVMFYLLHIYCTICVTRVQVWDLRDVGIGTVRQRGSCLFENNQLLVTEVAAVSHHCLWSTIVIISIFIFRQAGVEHLGVRQRHTLCDSPCQWAGCFWDRRPCRTRI